MVPKLLLLSSPHLTPGTGRHVIKGSRDSEGEHALLPFGKRSRHAADAAYEVSRHPLHLFAW